MFNYLAKRILWMIPTLIGITFITFLIMKLAPGDPTSIKLLFAGQNISPEALASELAKKEEPLQISDGYLTFAHDVSRFFTGEPDNTKVYKAIHWVGKNSLFYSKWLNNIVHLDFGLSTKEIGRAHV